MTQETHTSIRQWVSNNVIAKVAKEVCIQYGGSMRCANVEELLTQLDIDGGLIGGALLKAEFFNVINVFQFYLYKYNKYTIANIK